MSKLFSLFFVKEKFCKNCKYAVIKEEESRKILYCKSYAANSINTNYLTSLNNEAYIYPCSFVRAVDESCSKYGKYFEAK